jgi:hypothetical protein
MAQTQIELNNEINGEISSYQLIIKDSCILNHRLVICEICRKETYTQTLDYITTQRRYNTRRNGKRII